jgi:YspA, cpYpsA-related SLOG family
MVAAGLAPAPGIVRWGAGPTTPRRLLVTGSRTWAVACDHDGFGDYVALWEALDVRYDPDTVLVHGGCPSGADALADRVWRGLAARAGYPPRVEVHRADWRRYGRAAGFRRNQVMVTLGADECVAFIREHSRGATNAVKFAIQAGIPTTIFEVTSSSRSTAHVTHAGTRV